MHILDYRSRIKALSRRNMFFYRIVNMATRIYAMRGVKVRKSPLVTLDIYNIGKDNTFVTGRNCIADKLRLEFRGDNNMVLFGDNVTMKNDCRIMITGNNCTIEVGDNTSFTHHCQLEAQEEATHIVIGEDCMFSNNILVRTNDSHYIYDVKTGNRTNTPGDVRIGNHVWLAAYSTVMKGVEIGDGTVIGYRSVVTKDIPSNCIAVGMPAKVVKTDAEWSREPKKTTSNLIYGKRNNTNS